jgi:hypothetical protein
MAEDLESTIRENAQSPSKASGDSGSVEQHKLSEQIGADHAYEKKTVELTVQAGTPSGWTAFDTLTSATVMTDWQLNASTPAIEEKTRAGWGHWDAESGWTQIDTCNECEE